MNYDSKDKGTFEQYLEKHRLEIEEKKISWRLDVAYALMILFGVCAGLLFLYKLGSAWADSDMTDALQQCGRVTVESVDGTKTRTVTPANDLIVKCRDQVFEHFKVVP